MDHINVLVLAAGAPQFSTVEGDRYPSSLTEVGGKPLIELILERVGRIKGARFVFALREEEIAGFHLDRIVQLLCPNSTVIPIANGSQGSACTALMAACTLPDDEEVLILSANELIDVDFSEILSEFKSRKYDGGTLTFHSVHPRYSYVRLDERKLVVEVSQRRPISKQATTGTFWYLRAGDLVDSIKKMIRKGDAVEGSYYVAKAFNEMILRQKKIGVWPIEMTQYHPLKSDRHLNQFEQQGGL